MEKHGTLEKIPIDHKNDNRLRGIADYKRENSQRSKRIHMATNKRKINTFIIFNLQ